jgi:hypothetical protein
VVVLLCTLEQQQQQQQQHSTTGTKGNTGHPLFEGGQYEGLRNVKVIYKGNMEGKHGIALQGWGVGAVQGVRAARWGRGGSTQSRERQQEGSRGGTANTCCSFGGLAACHCLGSSNCSG